MPLGIIPISAVAEFVGIDMALLLAALLLAGSLLLLRWWIPELRHIDRGHGEEPDSEDSSTQPPAHPKPETAR
jgi:hypothetical protein